VGRTIQSGIRKRCRSRSTCGSSGNGLFVCAGTIFGVAILALWPAQQLIPIIARTYFPHVTLNAFGPADAVWAIFKFAIYIAIVIGLPVILYQVWMFVVPAIHPKTRKAVYIYIAPSIVLAAAGIAFAHFIVIKRVIGGLLFITGTIAQATFGIESTINLVLLLFLAFALIFQTPVIMVAARAHRPDQFGYAAEEPQIHRLRHDGRGCGARSGR